MGQGIRLKNLILDLQEDLATNGNPVIVDGMGTVEILNEAFEMSYKELIDIDDIRLQMVKYYVERKLNIKELEELEKDEYSKIYNEIINKSELFKDDINSRRVLWTDDCCISMLHYLVRGDKIYCYLHLRSSDVVYKLFSDLTLIHSITRYLQEKLGIYNATIRVNANSFHEVVIKDTSKLS